MVQQQPLTSTATEQHCLLQVTQVPTKSGYTQVYPIGSAPSISHSDPDCLVPKRRPPGCICRLVAHVLRHVPERPFPRPTLGRQDYVCQQQDDLASPATGTHEWGKCGRVWTSVGGETASATGKGSPWGRHSVR
eukprot:365096-Chlamydomonas_euryale.AAC.8